MNTYIAKWIRIIEEMKNDNTYKTAWGRGIVECVFLGEYTALDQNVIVKQSDVANKMIKYYWNQTFFFGLEQGKNPVILQHVQAMIDKYKEEVSVYPVPWDKAEPYFFKHRSYYDKHVKAILRNAKTNVCPRFLRVGKDTLDVYQIDDKNKTLMFNLDDIEEIKEFAFVLAKLFNYKWAQLLERYNTAPKIASKVNAAAEQKVKRQSLQKYKQVLLEFFHDTEIRDFYTGEVIEKEDIHVDHVIPWSFIYSDEIWNLVVTKSNNNLSKSNRPPTQEEIEKLKLRNLQLLDKLPDKKHEKYKKSIQYALNEKLLDKLFVNMKG